MAWRSSLFLTAKDPTKGALATSSQLNAALAGRSANGGVGRPTMSVSIGQILDLYVIHMIVAIFFIIGGILLIDRYAQFTSKPFTTWDDIFYTIGGIALGINAIFVVGLIIAWISKEKALSREDDSIHWLHAISVIAAGFGLGWGILALIITFGDVLAGTTADQTEVAGYVMVLVTVFYFAYLIVRYFLGLAGTPTTVPIQAPTTLNSSNYLSGIWAASGGSNFNSAQPLFGGGSGAAAFGGIDLSGLQPSSLSTLPPIQASSHCAPQAQCAPMMMMPQMMMMAPQQMCAPDPNAIHLS